MFVRIILTLLLIYASYRETGAFTATSFLLIFLYIELQGRLTKRPPDVATRCPQCGEGTVGFLGPCEICGYKPQRR